MACEVLNGQPSCTLAWDQWLRNGPNGEASKRFQKVTQAAPSCDRLQIEAARLQRNAAILRRPS